MDRPLARLPTDDRADRAGFDEVQVDTTCAQFSRQCPDAGWKDMLLKAGLRPTRRRVILSELLFARGERHVTAEMLFAEARETGFPVSQSTVYKTLNQFTRAGLSGRIRVDGSRSFFDTNTTPHPHYYLGGDDILLNGPDANPLLVNVPVPLPATQSRASI